MTELYRMKTSDLTEQRLKKSITERWDATIEQARVCLKPRHLKRAVRTMERTKEAELAYASELFAKRTKLRMRSEKNKDRSLNQRSTGVKQKQLKPMSSKDALRTPPDTKPVKRPRAVVQIDERGDLFYYADGDVEFLVIDERSSWDRVYALSNHRVSRSKIDKLIGRSRIGRWDDTPG